MKHTRMVFTPWPAFLMLALVGAYALPVAAAERGWFGIGVNIEADGDTATTQKVRTVTIQSVAPESPAAKAGLAAGDVILEADSQPLPGLKVSELRAAMGKSVGETLHLKVRREGTVRVVAMVAVAAPPGA